MEYCYCKNNWIEKCENICENKESRLELKKIIGIQNKYNKKISESKNCLHAGCKEKTINSHLISRSQLNKIANDYKVIIPNIFIHNLIYEKKFIAFKEEGINQIFTFSGYCKKHDTDLFSIKGINVDTGEFIPENEYAVFMLFYRFLARQTRVVSAQIELLKSISKNKGLEQLLKNCGQPDSKFSNIPETEALEKVLNTKKNNYAISDSWVRKILMLKTRINFNINPNKLFVRSQKIDAIPSFLGIALAEIFKYELSNDNCIFLSYINNTEWYIAVYCDITNDKNIENIKQISEEDFIYFIFWHLLNNFLIALNPNIWNKNKICNLEKYMNQNYLEDKNLKNIKETVNL